MLLIGREHYLCHWLLWKTNKENHKLFLAYHKISFSKNIHQKRYFKICSKQYEILRNENSKIKSIQTSGENNPMFGIKRSKETLELIQRNRTKVVYTDELRSKLRNTHIGKCLGSLNPMFGKSPKNAKPVVINNVKYSSMNKAAMHLNTTVYEIFKLLRSVNNDSQSKTKE